MDKVFQPCDYSDSDNCKEVLSLNNLNAGNCTWSTCQVLLKWVIDIIKMALSLPPHQENRFKETLIGILCIQKRIDI